MSRFNRVCRPLSCVNRRDSCEQCHTVHDKCINCRDSTYLHENTCHTECPALFEGVGNGRYNRRCRLDEACRRNVDGCTRASTLFWRFSRISQPQLCATRGGG